MIEYRLNKASEAEIADHLLRCDAYFLPPLSERVEVNDYAKKITRRGTRFEAWSGDTLIGLVAAYCNDRENGIAYITSVSVLYDWRCKGIATRLILQCIENAKASGMRQISLQVAESNMHAVKLYERSGFAASRITGKVVTMELFLVNGGSHEHQT